MLWRQPRDTAVPTPGESITADDDGRIGEGDDDGYIHVATGMACITPKTFVTQAFTRDW